MRIPFYATKPFVDVDVRSPILVGIASCLAQQLHCCLFYGGEMVSSFSAVVVGGLQSRVVDEKL